MRQKKNLELDYTKILVRPKTLDLPVFILKRWSVFFYIFGILRETIGCELTAIRQYSNLLQNWQKEVILEIWVILSSKTCGGGVPFKNWNDQSFEYSILRIFAPFMPLQVVIGGTISFKWLNRGGEMKLWVESSTSLKRKDFFSFAIVTQSF